MTATRGIAPTPAGRARPGGETAPPATSGDTTAGPRRAARARAWLVEHGWRRELVLLLALYGAYSLIRNLVPDQVAQAQANARAILDAERAMGIDVELALNLAAAPLDWLIVPANYYYATLHMTATAAVLVWLYRRRPLHYVRARGVLLAMTVMALACYWLYPLAPPRLMTGGGYVDTVREHGLWGFTPTDEMVDLSNQYAAMPSMHFGWSLWVGVVLVAVARRPLLRVLGGLYPLLTLAVIVITGNHFLLDAAAAVVLFVVALALVEGWARVRARRTVRSRARTRSREEAAVVGEAEAAVSAAAGPAAGDGSA